MPERLHVGSAHEESTPRATDHPETAGQILVGATWLPTLALLLVKGGVLPPDLAKGRSSARCRPSGHPCRRRNAVSKCTSFACCSCSSCRRPSLSSCCTHRRTSRPSCMSRSSSRPLRLRRRYHPRRQFRHNERRYR